MVAFNQLDGDSHFTDDAIEYDGVRTIYLNALNIKVLRFLNTDVYNNLNIVGERILEELTGENLTPPNPLLTKSRRFQANTGGGAKSSQVG